MRGLVFLFSVVMYGQTEVDGTKSFETRCAVCHGGDARGGEFGPSIVARVQAANDRDLAALIHSGIPNRGMPPFNLAESEMKALVAHLR